MTFGRASAFVMALLGAMALGVWVGPYVTDRGAAMADEISSAVSPASSSEARAADKAMPAGAPEVRAHLKPLLHQGTDMTMAADGFRSAEEFAMVAHAAYNTEVPFVVLKHRMLTQGKTLAATNNSHATSGAVTTITAPQASRPR